jgi:hypothetical protein
MEQHQIATILRQVRDLHQLVLQAYDKIGDLPKALYFEMFGNPIDNPKGWMKKKLGELGEWKSGGTPPRSRREYFQGNIPWYSSGELGELFVIRSKECISEKALEVTSARLIQPGSILLGLIDTAALKSSIATVNCSCNQNVAFSKLDDNIIDVIFAYYTIQLGKDYFKRFQRGVRQKSLNLSMIREISVPVPPISLQKDYIEKLSRIRNIIEHYSKALDFFDCLLETLLAYAFTGELTKNWRENFAEKNEFDGTIENGITSAVKLLKVSQMDGPVRVPEDAQKQLIEILQSIIEAKQVLRPNVTAEFLSISQVVLRLLNDSEIKDNERNFQMKLLISLLPNKKHPRFRLLDELSNEQYKIYLATIITTEDYFVSDTLADNTGLPLSSISIGMELLEALGLTLHVSLPAKPTGESILYLPVYCSLHQKKDDARINDIAVLGETSR